MKCSLVSLNLLLVSHCHLVNGFPHKKKQKKHKKKKKKKTVKQPPSQTPSQIPSQKPSQSLKPSQIPSQKPSQSLEPSQIPSQKPSQSLEPSKTRFVFSSSQQLKTAVDLYIYGNKVDAVAEYGDIEDWNTGDIVDFSYVFDRSPIPGEEDEVEKPQFNGDLSKWDVSQGTNFNRMFSGQALFNSNLSMWDVGKSSNLKNMFIDCYLFNSDLSKWRVDKVTNFFGMFFLAIRDDGDFNSDLSKWNVDNGNNFGYMFSNQPQFNQNLCSWEIHTKYNVPYSYFNPFADTGCETSEIPTAENACRYCNE